MRRGVQRIYDDVAGTYELVNHVLTLGFDVVWRKRAARFSARHGGDFWLDLCCGTGEMVRNLARLRGAAARIVGLDFNLPMIAQARRKIFRAPVSFVSADATRLPLAENSADLVTISFATRNLNTRREELLSVLHEIRRILKPGGCFLNLETSQPEARLLKRLFHLYIRLAVRPVGSALSGAEAGYRYLAHTIPRFYSAGEFSGLLEEAGLTGVSHFPYLFGIAALHRAYKPAQTSTGSSSPNRRPPSPGPDPDL